MKINPDDFTEAAWQGIINAKDFALTQNHQNLETEHLLYPLLIYEPRQLTWHMGQECYDLHCYSQDLQQLL